MNKIAYYKNVVHNFQPAVAPVKTVKKAKEGKVIKDNTKNVMRNLHIRKLCLNICVGESGDRLTRAAKVSSVI